MLSVSDDLLRTVRSSHDRVLVATISTPTATAGVLDPAIEFAVSGGTQTAAFTNGQRYEANLDVTPDESRDWQSLILTPGAIIALDVKIRTVGNAYETVRLCTGELSSAPSVSLYRSGFSITIQDQWKRLERCRYLSPWTTSAGRRSDIITKAVTGAIPGCDVIVSPAASGSHEGGVPVDKMRTDLIIDLANDSDPDYSVGFNAEGDFQVSTQPTIDLAAAVWDVTDGDEGTLLDFQQTVPVDRMYNTVVVKPGSDNQTWSQVVVEITDVNHPRHKSKIGVVPYFQVAPTASGASVALNIGIQTLQRIINQQSALRVISVDNPALEPGDVISVTLATGPNSGKVFPAAITNISRDLQAGTMELECQQNADTDIGESDET